MKQVLEGLLMLARAESRELPLSRSAVDLSELCREVVAQLSILAEERSQTLEVDAQAPVVVQADRQYVRQALMNVVAVLAEGGAKPEHIVRMTWYLTDKREYLAAARDIGAAFREIIGSFNAAMTAVQVSALIEDRAKVEIEVTAVIPD